MTATEAVLQRLAHDVRMYVLTQAAATTCIPQRQQIAEALGRSEEEIDGVVRHLAAGRILVLAPNDGDIWAAEPFCAVPSNFRIEANGKTYWALCIWDALGVPAALNVDATVHTSCGDCCAPMTLQVQRGALEPHESIVHFGVPARHFWDNVAFT